MDSFPSSWIIATEEPPKTGSLRRRRSPSPVSRSFKRPPLPCGTPLHLLYQECVPGTTDDLHPSKLHHRDTTPRSIPLHLQLAATAEQRARDASYLSSDDRFPSQFPMHWLLGDVHDVDTISNTDYDLSARVERQRAMTLPTAALVPLSAYLAKTPSFRHKPPTRQLSCSRLRPGSSSLRTVMVDEMEDIQRWDGLLAELKEPRNSPGGVTHAWVQSHGQRVANYAHENSTRPVDHRLCTAGEMHPSNFDETFYSDESGLGDLPHVVRDMSDIYSIYSTSSKGHGYANGPGSLRSHQQAIT